MLPVAILAGGLATRLRPVTSRVPKALIEICGEPFVAHQLRLLRANRVERVVLCVGYLGQMVREAIGNGRNFSLQVDYIFDGPVLLGTAGAIKKALPALGHSFFVLYGDSYLPCDYDAVWRAFIESGKTGLMTVFRNEGLWDRSNVECEDGKILAYDKQNRTPRMRFIDYGLGVFQSTAFDCIPDGEPHDLATVYQDLLRKRELTAFEVKERFYEIGSPEGIRDMVEFLSRQGPERMSCK